MAQEVIEIKLSPHLENWDIFALHSNAYLYENEPMTLCLLFFDGEECFEYFKICRYPSYVFEDLDDENSRCLQDAFRIYGASLAEYWNSDENIAALANDEYEQKLPKELCRSRFTRNAAFLGLLVGAALSLPISFGAMKDTKRITPNRVLHVLAFFKMKARQKPEYDLDKWDDIARPMNDYLSRKKLWQKHGYFYDGKDWRERFKSTSSSIFSVQNLQNRFWLPELIPFARISNAGFERDGESPV